MRTELSPVARRLDLSRPRGLQDAAGWSGRCGSVEVTAAVAGIGTRRAAATAEALIERARPDHVVVAGVAGGLAPDLCVGDIVVPATVRDLDDGSTHQASVLGRRQPAGELLTSGVMHGWDVLEAEAASGALAIDMETSAVAAVCERHGVPWSAIRALSDVVQEGTVDDATLGFVREDGSTDLVGVARYLGRHPRRVTALAAMGRDASRATSAVARLLHEELQALSDG
jgi:adenosylhomocysteine nucleosidase